MLPAAMRSWFGQLPAAPGASPSDDGGAAPDQSPAPADTKTAPGPPHEHPSRQAPNLWPTARTAITNHLWGRGFTFAGGEVETLQLIRSLGLSSASSLLLIGGGGGGPASAIVRNFGTWITGLEADPVLVANAKAMIRSAQLEKKASIGLWEPDNPQFARGKHHHCLAIEPLRSGSAAEPIIDSLSQTIKPNGQLVMVDLVADALPTNDVALARWAKLEGRSLPAIPTANAVTRMMTRVGFDVRIVEDISTRHIRNAMIGWRSTLRELQREKPAALVAAQLVSEAELWLLRVRLLKDKRLRMMRWHAIGRGPPAAGSSAAGTSRPA